MKTDNTIETIGVVTPNRAIASRSQTTSYTRLQNPEIRKNRKNQRILKNYPPFQLNTGVQYMCRSMLSNLTNLKGLRTQAWIMKRRGMPDPVVRPALPKGWWPSESTDAGVPSSNRFAETCAAAPRLPASGPSKPMYRMF